MSLDTIKSFLRKRKAEPIPDYMKDAYVTVTFRKDGGILAIQPHKESFGLAFKMDYRMPVNHIASHD
jgi:hypothetical protein